jgi:hypothetical protein
MHVFILFNVAMQFGDILKQWLPSIARSDKNKPFEEQDLIP